MNTSGPTLDLYKVIREGKAGLVMVKLALSAYQRRIAEQFGIEPGAELRAAIVAAKERDLPLQLVDRDLATTLRRSDASVPWYKRLYLKAGLALGMVSSEDIDEESIEKLKQGDILESTIAEFAEMSPELFEALIAERDRYMAARLRQENAGASGRKVLVVIGAGHMEGLSGHLETSSEPPTDERERLEKMPRRAIWPRLIPWAIMVLILTGFYVGFSRSPELGWRLVFIWVAVNGGLAGLGALIARGHPLTILSAILAAPLTSLNPTIAAGMVTGLVESWIRKPPCVGPGKPSFRYHDTEGLVQKPGNADFAGILSLEPRFRDWDLGGWLQNIWRPELRAGHDSNANWPLPDRKPAGTGANGRRHRPVFPPAVS